VQLTVAQKHVIIQSYTISVYSKFYNTIIFKIHIKLQDKHVIIVHLFYTNMHSRCNSKTMSIKSILWLLEKGLQKEEKKEERQYN